MKSKSHSPPADARAFLDLHPEVRGDKSAFLEIAYEEYRQRIESGDAPDVAEFCRRFPTHQSSLYKLIEADQFLDSYKELFEDTDDETQWPQVGEVFLGFVIQSELGRGAFARVYLANELNLAKRPVALKVSRSGSGEAQTLGRLAHPGIVSILSVKTEQETGRTAVCMEFLGGATLQDALDVLARQPNRGATAAPLIQLARRPPLPRSEEWFPSTNFFSPQAPLAEAVARMALAIAEALAFIHKCGIVHRDLKPSNVLLRPNGRPVLLDFNLAVDVRQDDPRLGGTLPYMAPEQLQSVISGTRTRVGPEADLYSLGVLIYELLVGTTPFGNGDTTKPLILQAEQILERQRRGIGDFPRGAHVPSKLAALVQELLRFDPAQRPPNAAAVVDRLRKNVLANSRNSLTLKVLFLTLLGVAGAIGAFSFMNKRPTISLLDQAWVAHTQGDEARVREYLSQAPLEERRLPCAQILLGVHFLKDQRYALGCANLSQADPQGKDPIIQGLRSYALSHAGDHAEALEAGTTALAGCPTTWQYANNLAYTRIQMNRYAAAEEYLKRAAAGPPESAPVVSFNRMVLAYRARRYAGPWPNLQKALGDIEIALPHFDNNGEFHLYAALLYAALVPERPELWSRTIHHLDRAQSLGIVVATTPPCPGVDRAAYEAYWQELLSVNVTSLAQRTARLALPPVPIERPATLK